MKNKTIKNYIWIIGLVMVVGTLFLAGKTPSVRNSKDLPPSRFAASFLQAAETIHDFGTISMAKGEVSKTFTVKNTGSVPVAIKKIYTSCMCTTASIRTSVGLKGPFGMPGHGIVPAANLEIQGGETAEVIVVFDPAAHGPAGVGTISRTVYLEEASESVLELYIKATVMP